MQPLLKVDAKIPAPRIRQGYTKLKKKTNKPGSHVKTLGSRSATQIKSHTKDPQILDVAVQNISVRATCHPGFVQLWDETLRKLNIKHINVVNTIIIIIKL